MAERIKPPNEPYGAEVRDDRIGMSLEELLDRGLAALEELLEEDDRLHRHLPRKLENRVRALSENRRIVAECIRAAKTKAKIARRSVEGR